jgi:hypothetical protein
MTVAELVEWLRTQDQDAVVEVVKHERAGSYYEQGGTADVVPFDATLITYYPGDGNRPGSLLLGESE